mmetsp:Transcript_21315/g.31609  ORF Transcript_21315/g.31609 Transcript_21315/m.31609 type:complete len:802 (-) Transcript_21315:50-2455(-)
MSRMGSSCSALRQRAFFESEDGSPYAHQGDASSSEFHRSVRHSVVSQVPDDSISALYPKDDNYVMDDNNLRSPKSLVNLCTDSLCRALPYLDGELPAGLPQDIVNDIVKSLMQHSALNERTLRTLKNCEIGVLSLAGCRGVSDKWLEPFSTRTPTCSPTLTNSSTPTQEEYMEIMNLGTVNKTNVKSIECNDEENYSVSVSSFMSASSTPPADTSINEMMGTSMASPQSFPLQDCFVPKLPVSASLSATSITSTLFVLDLRGSQGLTDHGLMQLSNLGSLEVAKLDNCHSLIGRGLIALASSCRLHTLSLANCRRLTDDAVINISHLVSIKALILDGCRCLTDRSLVAISNLYELCKLDMSQCDLITNEGLDHLEELDALEELSLGWCRMISDRGLDILTQQPGRSSLRVLRISRCAITDTGVGHLARLLSLEALDCNGCSNIGSATVGKLLGQLPKLEHLDVSYCPGILRSSWQEKVIALRSLELCYSGVRDSHIARLTHLPSLEDLNLDSCPVGDWTIAHLAENNVVPNLKNLDLADTDLTDNGMAHIPKFKMLSRLSLFYCNITNSGLRHLASMTSLETLNLDSRDISDEGLSCLHSLKNLKSLDIFSGRITDAGCSHISKIKSLETLELCGGGVGDLGCSVLAHLDNLTSLNLSQNERITNRGAAALGALTNLRALNLSNTRVNSAALRYLSGLVKLQSLTIYGCRGIDNKGDGFISFQNGLPNLKCFKTNKSADADGIIQPTPTEDSDDDDSRSGRFSSSPGADDAEDDYADATTNQDMEDNESQFEDASVYSEHD